MPNPSYEIKGGKAKGGRKEFQTPTQHGWFLRVLCVLVLLTFPLNVWLTQ